MSVAERAAASARIAQRLDDEVFSRVDGIVALYAAKGSEVDTMAIDTAARARGLRVVYPRVVEGERVLAFHEVGVGELVSTSYGLREPASTAPAVPVADIAAFVVPGLAFDRRGGRLGWGKGYYDATLAGAAGMRVGLAFECQVIDVVETEAHDVRMQLIVTEVATHVV